MLPKRSKHDPKVWPGTWFFCFLCVQTWQIRYPKSQRIQVYARKNLKIGGTLHMVIKTPTRPVDFNRSSHSSSCWFQRVGAFIELLISTRCKLLISTGWGWTCQFYWPHRGGREAAAPVLSIALACSASTCWNQHLATCWNQQLDECANLLKSTTRWMRRPVEINWSCWGFNNHVKSI